MSLKNNKNNWDNRLAYIPLGFLIVNGLAFLHHKHFKIPQKPSLYNIPSIVGSIGGLVVGYMKDNLESQVRGRTQELEKELKEKEILEQKLRSYAHTDIVTGISNRRVFEENLIKEFRLAKREDKELSLIMADIDFFKNYNDFYGHQKGDKCLNSVAQSIKNSVSRASDSVSRYGGEEFAVLLPKTSMSGAEAVAKKILYNLAMLKIPHQNTEIRDCHHVTLSLGVSSIIPNNETVDLKTLVESADSALYIAKDQGRNRYILANQT